MFLKELHYEERDVENELLLIEATRKQMAPLLRTLRPEQFQKSGVHTTRGLITLERVVQLVSNHIAHHVPFIHEKRKALNI